MAGKTESQATESKVAAPVGGVVMPPDAPKDVVPWLYVIRSEFLPDDANLGRESDVRMREALDWATSFVQAHRLCSPPEHYAAVAELIEVSRMGAKALEAAAKLIDHDFAILLRDRANFIRAALAPFQTGGAE